MLGRTVSTLVLGSLENRGMKRMRALCIPAGPDEILLTSLGEKHVIKESGWALGERCPVARFLRREKIGRF